MNAAPRPLSRLLRDLFRLESLEPRILLSADPVLGVAAAVLAPTHQDEAAAVLAQYAPQADLVVATTPGQKVLVTNGPARDPQPGWLVIDVSQLGGGNGNLVIGGPDSDARIQIGEEGGPTVVLHDLVLLNPAQGGHVDWMAPVALTGALVTVGSGHTDDIKADTNAAIISYTDSVNIWGTRTITADNVNGSIQIGGSIDPNFILGGNSDAVADYLTLRADGNVTINDIVGGSDALEGLTITSRTVNGTDLPSSVTFNSSVLVNGDLRIDVQAGGTVTFNGDVTLTNGGDLIITGAGSVLFTNHRLTLTDTNAGLKGDVTISSDEIDFGNSSETIGYNGAGVLTLRPAVKGYGIEIGTTGGPTANTLNLDAADLRSLYDGFTRIVIGWDDGSGNADLAAGAVRIGAATGATPWCRTRWTCTAARSRWKTRPSPRTSSSCTARSSSTR
jgi:hypothetical protein